jgi:hypothetical protein
MKKGFGKSNRKGAVGASTKAGPIATTFKDAVTKGVSGKR